MNCDHNFLDDFRAACEDLIGDVVLLESLVLCREQGEGRQSPEQFALLVRRVTDYLNQHTQEVLQLTNK
ncbi:MAG: hypothetical protein J6Q14_06560 [Oscillospiraceae bacterium]|nr:hypothetical protein [Oscillospiraceae bacterium]